MRRRALLALSAMLAVPGAAIPQPTDADRAALVIARGQADAAEGRAAALESQAAAAGTAAGVARAKATVMAERIRAAEAEITAADARVRMIEAQRIDQARVLAAQQGPLARLAAALASLARRPPAVALAQPGSLDDLVHVRLLLDAAIPAVAARTADVRAALARSAVLRTQQADAAAELRDGRRTLAARRADYAALAARQSDRSMSLSAQAEAEGARALALGADARDLVDRMAQRSADADIVRRLEALPEPAPAWRSQAAPPSHATPRYRLAAPGSVIAGLGEVSDAGVAARGVTLATPPGAAVIAPHAGRVAYAGVFRGYGAIVVIDHGGGWTTLVTGLAAAAVKADQPVAQGQTIGTAPARDPRVTIEARRNLRPIDVVALAAAG